MHDFWLGVMLLLAVPGLVVCVCAVAYFMVCRKFLDTLMRIFVEKPLFIIPRGEPRPGAEDVPFQAADGTHLRGCYLATEQPRKGVILFGLEFGSNRWSCRSYCESLVANGYDVFTYEPRNQGDSDKLPGYEPLQWITAYERTDIEAALAYLKSRPDADPKGIGFFGISKGANAGLIAASEDPFIRCIVTDGAFGTASTMVPYMRKWVSIYSDCHFLHGLMPVWFYGLIASAGMRRVQRQRQVKYLHVEPAMRKLRRPLTMIHGEADTYIKTEMARELFRRADNPKTFWVVPKAKHNQALHVAGEEYARRVLAFFDLHLAGIEPGMLAKGEVDPESGVICAV